MQNHQFILDLVKEAGNLALKYLEKDNIKIIKKPDGSPVTEADIALNELYIKELTNKFINIPIVSEEQDIELNQANHSNLYFLIDPIDGTKAFINRNGDFVTQIALMSNQRPIFAAIYNPLKDELYYSDNEKSYLIKNNKTQIIKVVNNNPPIIYISNRLRQKTEYSNLINLDFDIKHASSSYKFCILANGKADLIPYLNETSSWDIAPPDLIVRKAGGIFCDLNHKILFYNQTDFKCGSFIAASNNENFHKCLNVVKKI